MWSGVCVLSHSVMSSSLWPHGLQPARLLCSWGFSRQEYWSGLPCPPPGDLPNPGIEPRSPVLQADSFSQSVSSVIQSYLTLCDSVDCSTPGFPVHHQLPELAQTYVHWVGDAIQPSHPLPSPSLPAFDLSQRQGLLCKKTNNNEKDHLIQTDVRISSNSALSVELSLTEQTKQQNTPLPINMTLLNQSWIFIGRTDAEAETPILWPPDVKNWLIWKDPDIGKDWRQEEKGKGEDETVAWHHWLDGHEFE